MQYSANLSACGTWRHGLRRVWDLALPPLILGMLNPSTADHRIDDPTIRRGVGFARREQCGALWVWNLGAGRATSPRDWKAMADPVGPDNWQHVRLMMEEGALKGGLFVVGWGNHGPGPLVHRARELARELHVELYCLGYTKSGAPSHPLYLRKDAPLRPWPRQLLEV